MPRTAPRLSPQQAFIETVNISCLPETDAKDVPHDPKNVLAAVGKAGMSTLHHSDDVVDLQDHPHTLRRELERTGVDKHRLNHVLCVHVANCTLAYIDACTGKNGTSRGMREAPDREHVAPRALWHQLLPFLK